MSGKGWWFLAALAFVGVGQTVRANEARVVKLGYYHEPDMMEGVELDVV